MSKSKIKSTIIDRIALYDADSESEEQSRFENPIKSFTTKYFDSELAGILKILKTTSTCYGESFLIHLAKCYCRSPQKINTLCKRVKKPNGRFKPLGIIQKSPQNSNNKISSNTLFHFPPPLTRIAGFFL